MPPPLYAHQQTSLAINVLKGKIRQYERVYGWSSAVFRQRWANGEVNSVNVDLHDWTLALRMLARLEARRASEQTGAPALD